MSRHVQRINGEYVTQIVDEEKCKFMYDDTCCNDSSYWLADFPSAEECAECPYFEKERSNGK